MCSELQLIRLYYRGSSLSCSLTLILSEQVKTDSPLICTHACAHMYVWSHVWVCMSACVHVCVFISTVVVEFDLLSSCPDGDSNKLWWLVTESNKNHQVSDYIAFTARKIGTTIYGFLYIELGSGVHLTFTFKWCFSFFNFSVFSEFFNK